ncbi:MAG: amidohydrolase [Sphingobacteriales bacterium]|nr:amidohydrolase [Sphingobacteriales bacterium]
MVRKVTADYILTVTGKPMKNGIVCLNDKNEIIGLSDSQEANYTDSDIERYEGIITPGFINSHCHLELSHLEGTLPKSVGLVDFIKNVITKRDTEENTVVNAMINADQAMYENGIVAVGDISNLLISKQVKLKSQLYYHTFVEILGFEPELAKQKFRAGLDLKDDFLPLVSSVVPHASYSVCKDLFRFFRLFCSDTFNLFSIHNQESEEENKFFRYKAGAFVDFYKSLNINIDFFKPQGRNSIQSVIPLLPKNQKILLVHNTYTSAKDIYFLHRLGRDITWCFCPNANLYIENKLPKLELFLGHNFNITIGTDSLASNEKLCILSELKTLHKNFPSLTLTDSIAWATLNGARFLGIDDKFGSIEIGKKPGLNLITATRGLNLTPESTIKKLV